MDKHRSYQVYIYISLQHILLHRPIQSRGYGGAVCCAGQLFPDTDPKWKGASSDIFVKEAVSGLMLFLGQGGAIPDWNFQWVQACQLATCTTQEAVMGAARVT